MKRLFLLSAMIVMLNGCATMKHNYSPIREQADWPTLNQQTTVYMGEDMLVQGMQIKHTTLRVKSMVDGACYDIPTGTYLMTGYDEKMQYFNAVGSGGAVIRSGVCDPYSGLVIKIGKPDQICVMTAYGVLLCYNAQFSIEGVQAEFDENRQRSLLYSGHDGKEIKFTYVERQRGNTTFSHNVSYDMKRSPVINYRGAQIQIHDADNEQITYTVTKNFTERQK
jgi:hypothetical protein